MSDFGKRLTTALGARKRKDLAAHLGISVQAVGTAIRDGKFTAANTAKAARYLGVDGYWLATGEGEPAGLSPQSLKIAALLDRLVDDPGRYAIAYGLLRDQLDALLGVAPAPSPAPPPPQASPVPVRGKEKRGA